MQRRGTYFRYIITDSYAQRTALNPPGERWWEMLIIMLIIRNSKNVFTIRLNVSEAPGGYHSFVFVPSYHTELYYCSVSCYIQYLSHLNMGVFYGVGVTFDQLFHLPQVGLLNLLKLLLTKNMDTHTHTHTHSSREKKKQWLIYHSLWVDIFG